MKIGSRASLKDRQLGVDDRPNSSDGFVELAALGKLDVSGAVSYTHLTLPTKRIV